MTPLLRIAIVAVVASVAQGAGAATIWTAYGAGDPGAYVPNPFEYVGNWLPGYLTGNEQGIKNVDGTGHNAWRISDSIPSIPNPHYIRGLTQNAWSRAQKDGWRLTTFARYVYVKEFANDGPSMGLTAYMGGREYDLMLNVSAAGNLQATLFDDQVNQVFPLTTGGVGAYNFHNFELRNAGNTPNVQLYFDGRLINGAASWDGRAFTHDNTVQWGNSNRAGSARGVMDFNYVAFRLGPFDDKPGDLDANRIVDGNDFLWLQRTIGSTQIVDGDFNGNGIVDSGDFAIWGRNFASTSASNAVPEPATATATMLLAIAPIQLVRRIRHRSSRISPA